VLGNLQRCHRREIDHVDATLDPTVPKVLATLWTGLGRMIDPLVRPLQLEAAVIVLRRPLLPGLLLALRCRRLTLGHRSRGRGQRHPAQVCILLLKPCHLLTQERILLRQSS